MTFQLPSQEVAIYYSNRWEKPVFNKFSESQYQLLKNIMKKAVERIKGRLLFKGKPVRSVQASIIGYKIKYFEEISKQEQDKLTELLNLLSNVKLKLEKLSADKVAELLKSFKRKQLSSIESYKKYKKQATKMENRMEKMLKQNDGTLKEELEELRERLKQELEIDSEIIQGVETIDYLPELIGTINKYMQLLKPLFELVSHKVDWRFKVPKTSVDKEFYELFSSLSSIADHFDSIKNKYKDVKKQELISYAEGDEEKVIDLKIADAGKQEISNYHLKAEGEQKFHIVIDLSLPWIKEPGSNMDYYLRALKKHLILKGANGLLVTLTGKPYLVIKFKLEEGRIKGPGFLKSFKGMLKNNSNILFDAISEIKSSDENEELFYEKTKEELIIYVKLSRDKVFELLGFDKQDLGLDESYYAGRIDNPGKFEYLIEELVKEKEELIKQFVEEFSTGLNL